MRKQILGTFVLLLFAFSFSKAQQSYAPFLKTSPQEKTVLELSNEISTALNAKNFEIIGQYKPMQSDDLLVICFSRKDLKQASLSFKDRGALASVLKIGLQKTGSSVTLSLQNPLYMFYAYFRDDFDKQKSVLTRIDADAKSILSGLYGELIPFGGELSADKLIKYHYKMMMPYFDDPSILENYDSFEQGLSHIQTRLENAVGVKKVYEQIFETERVAVFGLAFLDPEKGESKYLPIIGESHLAAMPYEIILQGNEVSMLPGKYRIALYWPDLTMGTFMKIMSTPGNIEDAFKEVTEK
ncbi:MAG: hypothetical protein JW857_01215 [Bacteroidales bacterium]|nr:hypothetical protein [Bacteroidales bacterium]